MNLLAVFLGAGIGGAARYGVSLVAARLIAQHANSWATFAVNITGSFLMGIAAYHFTRGFDLNITTRLFWTIGVLGGFTTFSAFSLELAAFVETGRVGLGFGYAVASVTLSLAALFLGMATARGLIG